MPRPGRAAVSTKAAPQLIRPRRHALPPIGDAAVRVGQRLRDLRNARGLSQSQLGAPFTRAHISAIEKGKITPSLAALIHLAKVLGVSVRELIPPDL